MLWPLRLTHGCRCGGRHAGAWVIHGTPPSSQARIVLAGEVTLTGRVLPIGGVKEKAIAARRSGVKTLIFPKANQHDFEELSGQLHPSMHGDRHSGVTCGLPSWKLLCLCSALVVSPNGCFCKASYPCTTELFFLLSRLCLFFWADEAICARCSCQRQAHNRLSRCR